MASLSFINSLSEELSKKLFSLLDRGQRAALKKMESLFNRKIVELLKADKQLREKIKKARQLGDKKAINDLKKETQAKILLSLISIFNPEVRSHPFIDDQSNSDSFKIFEKFVIGLLVKPNELGIKDNSLFENSVNFEMNTLVRLMIMDYIYRNRDVFDVLVDHPKGFVRFIKKNKEVIIQKEDIPPLQRKKIINNMKKLCGEMRQVAVYRMEHSLKLYANVKLHQTGKKIMQFSLGGAAAGVLFNPQAVMLVSAIVITGGIGSVFTGGLLGLVALGVGTLAYWYFRKQAVSESKKLTSFYYHGEKEVKPKIDKLFQSVNNEILDPLSPDHFESKKNHQLFKDEEKNIINQRNQFSTVEPMSDIFLHEEKKKHVEKFDVFDKEESFLESKDSLPNLIEKDNSPSIPNIKEDTKLLPNLPEVKTSKLSVVGFGLWSIGYGRDKTRTPDNPHANIIDEIDLAHADDPLGSVFNIN